MALSITCSNCKEITEVESEALIHGYATCNTCDIEITAQYDIAEFIGELLSRIEALEAKVK